jgi:gluconokinase
VVQRQPVVLLMGVSGSGKTTIGQLLAARIGCPFLDADDLHAATSVVKMQAGIPLTDEDRWPWLHLVTAWIAQQATSGECGIVGCSALKRPYRDLLRQGDPLLRVVYLRGDREVLTTRLNRRRGHFFPRDLLNTQLADLVEPTEDERPIVVSIGQSSNRTVDAILAGLEADAKHSLEDRIPGEDAVLEEDGSAH